MVSLRSWNDKVVGIFGAGPTGLSALSALGKAGAHVFIWDENERIRKKLAQAKVVCTPPDEWPWQELSAVIPGQVKKADFSLTHPILRHAQAQNVPVRSDVDIFAEALNQQPAEERAKIVGITGTLGKSMTADMIAHILREAGRRALCAGDAGKPVLSLPEGGANSVYVIEVPLRAMAFTTKLKCDAAILLNVADTDTRFFRKPEQTIRTATRIFRNQAKRDAMIIGADDLVGQKVCTAITSNLSSQTFRSDTLIPCSGEATLGLGVFSLEGHLFDARTDKTTNLGNLGLTSCVLGAHMNHNLAAASAACLHLGIPSSLIGRALQRWEGLSGRMQIAGDESGVLVLDDSFAGRLKPTIAALKSVQGIYWVGGGVDRQSGYNRLREVEDHVDKAFLFGEAGTKIQDATVTSFPSKVFATADEAITAALEEMRRMARKGEAPRMVIVSPGCPGQNPARLSAILNRSLSVIRKGHAA